MEQDKLFKWSEEVTKKLIELRIQHDGLFTGKRHTAKKAWTEIIRLLNLQGQVTQGQVSKKWDNLKRKYKELRNPPTGTGTDGGEATAATWPWFSLMHEAIGARPCIEPPVLMDSCVGENPHTDAAGAFMAGPSSTVGSAACRRTLEEEEEEEEEETEAQPGTSCGSYDGPSTSTCPRPPPRKRTRPNRGALLNFLKEEAAREEERFKATYEQNERLICLLKELSKNK
ncbi:uncharacterized protein LOC141806935 [Halichoeres trimaculatus]|uniref:uncharacterized protein LOC141806935 n=1 Tax=Halichoeres trimaculatus TaxID=147232 RepID=UPI003D9DE554